jgi:23S rRNA pseudouridine1911/1915/1917 synthase
VAIGGGVSDQPAKLLERSGVVAIAKPSGLATQAPPGLPSVEAWLRGLLPAGAYLGVPHRLDRAVSGVLLMATTPRAARQLSRQFERRQITKTYVAILAAGAATNPVAGAAVEWRDRIAKRPDVAEAHVVDADDPAGREAVTIARTLGEVALGRWLVELAPVTGRMHQLRVQAAARGMPVCGDTLYGGPALGGGPALDGVDTADTRRQPIALHALSIRFRDPDADGEVVVTAALPPHWPAAAAALLPAG